MIRRTSFGKTLLATSGRGGRLRLYRAGVGWLASTVVLATPVAAKSWRIADFNDNITVNGDGSAVITERISLVFEGEWHGIHRTIPIEYPGPNGTNYQLFISISGVTDGNGGKLKYDSSTSAGSLRAQAFTGAYGSAGHDARATVDGADALFETNSPLSMRGGMTIDVFI